MVTQEQWIEAVRGYVGTRFRHMGRGEKGIDCIGLVIRAAHDLGIDRGSSNYGAYAHTPDPGTLEGNCEAYMDRVPYNRLQPLRGQAKPGYVLLFWVEARGVPRHVGVYAGLDRYGRDMLIHSYAQEDRGVIEQAFTNSFWMQRIQGVFKLKDVDYGEGQA